MDLINSLMLNCHCKKNGPSTPTYLVVSLAMKGGSRTHSVRACPSFNTSLNLPKQLFSLTDEVFSKCTVQVSM